MSIKRILINIVIYTATFTSIVILIVWTMINHMSDAGVCIVFAVFVGYRVMMLCNEIIRIIHKLESDLSIK